MNPPLALTYLICWVAHPVLQAVVAITMIRRGLQRKFPIFFAYLLTEIVMFAICFPIYMKGSYSAFFYSYWILAVISSGVGFFVIHEIFGDIFRPFHTLKDLGTVLFTWSGFVMLMVAAVVAAASPTSKSPIVEAVMTLERCVRVIQCGLVLFLLVFSKYLGASRKQLSFGIMLGFGGFALVELAVVALFDAGRISEDNMSLLNVGMYNLAVVVWLGYCLVKFPVLDQSGSMLISQRWDRGLSDIQNPATENSLIPMFEGMVERAFSRNHGDASAPITEQPSSRLMGYRSVSPEPQRSSVAEPAEK